MQARLAFETLAKFHGVWLKWRHQAEKLEKTQKESSLLKLGIQLIFGHTFSIPKLMIKSSKKENNIGETRENCWWKNPKQLLG